jgi:hypothetical protein
MFAGLPAALALLAPAATATAPSPPPAASNESCSNRTPAASDRSIVICAPKTDGYRIDPDLLAARKAKKEALAGRPKPPNKMKDTSCTVVGPAPCMGAAAGINILGAMATAAEMAARLSKGQEIGSMFVTDPQPSEYQLYKEAKAAREAEEAEKKAKARAKAAAAAAAASPSGPPPKPASEGD